MVPTSITRPLLWVVLLLFAGAGVSRAQESGVLVGLRYLEPIPRPLPYYAGSADSLARTRYRTVLITRTVDTFAVTPAGDELLIPRNDRFWRVGTKRSIYNNWVEDFAWSAPEGSRPDYAGIQPFNGEYCEGHRTQTVLYAGPRYLSLDQRSAGYCEGGAHPWFFSTLATVPLDSTNHTGLAVDEVLGEVAGDALRLASEAFLDQIEDDDERAAYIPEPDPANWSLVRREGRWMVVGRLESAEAASQGHQMDLLLPLDVSPALTGQPSPRLAWEQVHAFAPNALDALVAPGADWMVLLRPTQLSIHPINEGTIGRPVVSQPLPPGTRVVMARWATEPQLRAWSQHIERLARSH